MAAPKENHAIHLYATMEIRRSGLIAKSARHGATRGDITTVQFQSDRRNERIKGGSALWDRGLIYAHNRGRPTDLHQIRRLALFAKISSLNTDVLSFEP